MKEREEESRNIILMGEMWVNDFRMVDGQISLKRKNGIYFKRN